MDSKYNLRAAATLICVLAACPLLARAELPDTLPDPLKLEDVLAYARAHRQEIAAAQAAARAAEQRPDIVGGLEDPMVMPSIDHLPFMLHGLDASLMIEQRFPLSGVLGRRRRVAQADARRLQAQTETVRQNVLLDVARAFLMLKERRDTARILTTQRALASDFVGATSGRYGAGTGSQPDVLRAEVELARLDGATRAIASEVAAAESMLNASLGRPVDAAIPPLTATPVDRVPRSWREVREASVRNRSELQVGRAEIGRADAEVGAMEAMYAPMGLLRTGPAYTMSDGWGVMLTLGISIPIWTGKYEAGIREAQAMASMARADVAAMTRMIEGEAASARYQVLALRERVLSLRDDVLPRARSAIAPAMSAYAAGTVPLVSVIDAAQSLWSLEAELVSAEFELGVAWARLSRALGSLEAGLGR